MEKLITFLDKNEIEYHENYDISLLSSIRLGCKINIVIFPKTIKSLTKLLTFLFQNKLVYIVAGNLSNMLFVDTVADCVILTSKMQDEIDARGNLVSVSAGTMLTKLCEFAKKNGLSGMEGLVGIPATVGGAIRNNAGAFGYQISDRLVSMQVFYNGRVCELKKSQIKFDYHYSSLRGIVVLSATFLFENKKEYDIINLYNEYTYIRNSTQPSGLSLGSVYRRVNGKSAGFYIERSGLKGTRVGGLVVASKHSNFFINDKNGNVSDFLRLSSLVENAVLKQFGVALIPEVEKVERDYETFSRPTYTF